MRPIDLGIVVLTLGMSALTLWTASAPIAHFFDFLIISLVWLPIGAVWALSLIVVRRPTATLGALVLLLIIGCSFLLGVGRLAGFFTTGLIALIALGGVALIAGTMGRAILLDRPHRVVWFVAPVIVVGTLGLALSGLPRSARFALAETALRQHASAVLEGPAVKHPQEAEPVVIGGLTIDFSAARGGCAHLVTTYVGILGEYPAGLAYCPSGIPRGGSGVGEYEALDGPWYRWFSGSEFPFE